MNKGTLLFALCTLLFALQTPQVFAAFEDVGTGARPTVMGGTYVAAGDNVESLMYNPAGLAQLHTHELTSEYSRLYTGLSDGSALGQYFVGYGQPIKYGGTIAMGWKQFSLDNLYTERTLSLGYGEWITSRVAAGLAFKQLHHSFEAPSISVDDSGNVQNTPPSFFTKYGNSSTAYSMDLGVLVRWTDRDTVGLSIQDVNEPNIALNPADHEIVSRTVRLGLAHKADRGLNLAGGLTTRESLSNQKDYIWTGAVEKWWEMKDKTAFAARGSLATGSRSFQQMAMGASYRFLQYQVDYAFVFNISGVTLGNTAGTHRFAFSYRFGKESKENVRLQAGKTAQRSPRRTKVEDIPELEDQPKSARVALPPVAGQRIVRSKSDMEIPETTKTAQMMNATPEVSVETPQPGPGLRVQVPAPVPAAAMPEASVQPQDMQMPIQAAPAPAEMPVESMSRTQLMEWVDGMTSEYARRIEKGVSAEARLGAFTALYPSLKGYVQGQGAELPDQLDLNEELDQSMKRYESLKFEGASADQRLRHLTQALETTLIPALRNRPWDMKDRRDRRYKAWLEQALAKGRRLASEGVGARARMMYWGQVARKAMDFERQPSEPVQASVVIPVKSAPAAPVQAPVSALEEAPVQVTPTPAPDKGIGRLLGDGEWLYRVRPGDTLLSLANRFYGDYNRWRDIYILNEDRVGRGGTLRTGQLLVMPQKKAR